MDRERRTRQSNREYKQRIRQDGHGNHGSSGNGQDYFSIIPKQDRRAYRTQIPSEHKEEEPRRRRPSESGNAPRRRRKTTANRHSAAARNERSPKKKNVERYEERPRKKTKKREVYFDNTLVFIVFFLVMFGLLMLFTASIYTNSFFVKQSIIAVVAFVVMYIFTKIDYHIYAYKPIAIGIAVAAVASIIMIWTPLGVELNGARRWIGIGSLSVQPAEIYKIALILVNATLINYMSKTMHKIKTLLLFLVIAIFSFGMILLLADNMSSAIIVGLITVLMVFVACPKYNVFLISGGSLLAVAGIFVYCCLTIENFAGFRGQRIIAWLQPEKISDPDLVFQSTQALYSIGSGGLWGKGLGNGTQKMILPEAMNDMIFAIICEEMGMIGAFLVLVMFAILLYRLLFIAKNSKDLLGGMIATGIFAHFMVQVILNIGVVTGLLPPTGVTLPFISSGGTALVLLLAEVGIALNVSRSIDFEQVMVRRRKKRR